MKKFIESILPIADVFLSPFVYVAAFLLKNIRVAGVKRMPICRKALFQVGVFPIRDHYYEPLFHPQHIKRPLSQNRALPGIDWNIEEQLEMLTNFQFSEELNNVPNSKVDDFSFYMNNSKFGPGDAEYWYNIIRLKKPSRIFEVGSGNSTLMAIKAIRKNEEDVPVL